MRRVCVWLICALLAGAGAVLAGERDPVTLTFVAGGERLMLELGLVKEVRVNDGDVSGNAMVHVLLSDEDARMMAVFTGKHVGEEMEVYACRERVLAATIQVRITSGQFSFSRPSGRQATKMADMIWHGEGCDLYLP